MHNSRTRLFLFAMVATLIRPATFAEDAAQGGLKVTDLRCEHLVNPLGIDDRLARLSWKLEPTNEGLRGQRQSAFQVLVASNRSLLDRNRGDLWDSARVSSDRSQLVSYDGKPLESGRRCWWKVRVWDERGSVSTWSPVAHWSLGLLTKNAWQPAQWIGLNEKVDPGVEIIDIKAANWLWYPEGNAAFDAPDRVEAAVPGDVGGLARPRRDGAGSRGDEQDSLDGGVEQTCLQHGFEPLDMQRGDRRRGLHEVDALCANLLRVRYSVSDLPQQSSAPELG